MKRVVVAGLGGHDRLRIEDAPSPNLAPTQVLIETRAIGVNFADVTP